MHKSTQTIERVNFEDHKGVALASYKARFASLYVCMTCVNLEGATIHHQYKRELKININKTEKQLLFRRFEANHSRFKMYSAK